MLHAISFPGLNEHVVVLWSQGDTHSRVGEGVVPKYIGLAIVYLILDNHYNL